MEESKFQIPWRTESVVSFAPCLDASAAHIGLHRYSVPWNFHAYQMVEYASNEYIMFRITTRDENGNGALELYYLMQSKYMSDRSAWGPLESGH